MKTFKKKNSDGHAKVHTHVQPARRRPSTIVERMPDGPNGWQAQRDYKMPRQPLGHLVSSLRHRRRAPSPPLFVD